MPTTQSSTPAFRIPLTRPLITDAIKARVCETLDSGWITEGPVTAALEARFAQYIAGPDAVPAGRCRAIATTSCTTGLETALRAIDIRPGDEVIVPDYTYPCTAGVVALLGATAVIVDVTRDTMLIDYDQVDAAVTDRTRAIIPVSIFGNPLDYTRLNATAERHDLRIVEDAACSVGSAWNGERVGMHADITVFSLHPRKTLTTGEGGMITTGSAEIETWMRSYKNFGMDKASGGWSFDMLGTNYKLSDILAAVGLAMFDDLDDLLARRAEIAEAYRARLTGARGIDIPAITPGGVHAWQSFPVFVADRDAVKEGLRIEGINAQIGTHALHLHRAFQDTPLVRFPQEPVQARYAYEHCLVLPMYHAMTESELDEVAEKLMRLVG